MNIRGPLSSNPGVHSTVATKMRVAAKYDNKNNLRSLPLPFTSAVNWKDDYLTACNVMSSDICGVQYRNVITGNDYNLQFTSYSTL